MRSVFKAFGLALTLMILWTSLGTTALAAPRKAAGKPSITITHGQETITLSAGDCAKLKASYPTYANDPRLCHLVHGWTNTVTTTTSSGLVAATSCPSGTSSYHDWVSIQVLYLWEIDLDTGWKWNGNCTAPSLTSKKCYYSYLINTTINSMDCYSYYYYGSSWVSQAAVQTVNFTTSIAGVSDQGWESQRRECYSTSYNDCNWTAWAGQ